MAIVTGRHVKMTIFPSLDKYFFPGQSWLDEYDRYFPASQCRSTVSGKVQIRLHQNVPKRITPRKGQFHLPSMGDYPRRHVHQLLNDLAQPAAFLLLPRHVPVTDALLTAKTKNIKCQYRKRQHQSVGCKLSAGKPLKRHIAFKLGMKLLAGPMVTVCLDHFIGACRTFGNILGRCKILYYRLFQFPLNYVFFSQALPLDARHGKLPLVEFPENFLFQGWGSLIPLHENKISCAL
jgi:hypothetical protein